MALVKRYYKNKLPPKVIKLVEWLITSSHFCNHDSFDDINGRTEFISLQLSFSIIMIIIDKTNDGNIVFQLEVEHE